MLSLKPLIDAADLGDTRRNKRVFELVASMLAQGPVRGSAQAPAAHAMASFRFYDNADVPLPALYGIAITAVRALVTPGERVYLAHDGSILDYSGHNARRDRIPVGDHRGLGYELFSTLALNARGRPLGPIFQEVRTAQGSYSSEPTRGRRPQRPAKFIGHIEQMEKAVEASKTHLPEQERVHLADREFDDVALQRGMFAGERPEFYVVRAQHMTRRVVHCNERTSLRDATDRVALKRGGVVERLEVRYRRFVGETEVVFDGLSWRGRHRG